MWLLSDVGVVYGVGGGAGGGDVLYLEDAVLSCQLNCCAGQDLVAAVTTDA